MGVLHVFQIVQMAPNRAKHYICAKDIFQGISRREKMIGLRSPYVGNLKGVCDESMYSKCLPRV